MFLVKENVKEIVVRQEMKKLDLFIKNELSH